MLVKFANNTLTNIFGQLSSGQNRTDNELDSLTESHDSLIARSVGGCGGLVVVLFILLIVVRRNMEAAERLIRQSNQLLDPDQFFQGPTAPCSSSLSSPSSSYGAQFDR